MRIVSVILLALLSWWVLFCAVVGTYAVLTGQSVRIKFDHLVVPKVEWSDE